MPIANINYNMNHTENTAFVIIKNEPSMLEVLFNGLFIAARRQLGYNPNASSFPFITRPFTSSSLENSKHERDDLEFAMKKQIVVTPDDTKHKNKEVLTLSLNGHVDQMREAIKVANVDADDEDKLNFYDINVNTVYMALVEDYWSDMVAFAKNNRYYDRRWQSLAA
jgi:hypothetical protein